MHPFLDDRFLSDALDGRAPIRNVDVLLAVEVVNRLSSDALTCRQGVAVHAQNGVVLLEGDVVSQACRFRAGEIAGGIGEVADVCNCLRVRPPRMPDGYHYLPGLPFLFLLLALWVLLTVVSLAVTAASSLG